MKKTALTKKLENAINNFRYKEGISMVEKELRKHPGLTNENLLYWAGFLYDHAAMRSREKNKRRQKEYERKAILYYKQILKLNPSSARATWGIGRVWLHRRDRKALRYALLAYRLRRKSGEKMGLYAQNVGLVYESLGNYDNAEKWFLRGLRENRNDYGSYLNLAVFYGRIRKDAAKAKTYAKKLRQLYKKEREGFKKTAWGIRIKNFIEEILGNKLGG